MKGTLAILGLLSRGLCRTALWQRSTADSGKDDSDAGGPGSVGCCFSGHWNLCVGGR